MELNEKTLNTERVFDGRVVKVDLKTVELPDGRQSKREVVTHRGAVCVLPMDTDKNVYLVKQFRSPFEEVVLEAPAGKLEENEDPKDAAARELLEETGLEANELIDFGYEYVSPGYSSEIIYLYGATNLTYKGQRLDDGEFLNVVKIPFDEVIKMTKTNEIKDGKTLLCIFKLIAELSN